MQKSPLSKIKIEGSDDEREFLTLEELKPHQLTELGLANHQPVVTQRITSIPILQGSYGNQHTVYYDLNTQQPTIENLYSGGMSEHEMIESDVLSHMNSTRSDSRLSKRTCPYEEKSDLEDDGGDDSKSVKTNDDSKKQNHSEIEKRRRDKMNTYITELSLMIPMCHAMSRKLDKLTVLRMAVQHLKSVRGSVHSFTEGHNKPTFLSEQELKLLILQAAEGFLFVVGCDRGRILYVSESVSEVLNFSQGDLLGQSWFDILHPKDVAKVKEQLSSSDLSPRERLIDAKTMLPVKTDMPQGVSRLSSGARRSFFCRMKCKATEQVKEEHDTNPRCHKRKKQMNADKKYSVIQCTGYLKSWPPEKIGVEEQEGDTDEDSCNLSCLVAIGRIPPNIFQPISTNNAGQCSANLQPIQFISRHAMDGKFLFVDQKATLVLGFLPHELLGTSMYEYYHHEDISALADSHKLVLETTETVTTHVYRIRTKDSGFIRLQSDWKKFTNPWTKEIEYLIAKNSVILSDFRNESYGSDGNLSANFEFFNQSNGRDMQRMISTHVEASKIGRQIADQVLDNQRRGGDTLSEENSPDPPDAVESHQTQNSDNDHSPDNRHLNNGGFNTVTSNTTVSPNNDQEIITMMGSCQTGQSEAAVTTSTTGNDEAAMAVIMSLLEADAGLGGSVDFSGLPWPLP